jgi:hypothetical protein
VNHFRSLLSLLIVTGALLSAPAGATTPSWGAGTISIPSGTGIANGQVTLLSCLSAGNCLAGGWYGTNSGATETFFTHELNQNWSIGTKVPDPAGGYGLMLSAISCATTQCIGVGQSSLGATLVQYNWSTQSFQATSVVNFANNLLDTTHSSLKDVTCISDGNCVAVGSVNATPGTNSSRLLVDSMTSGAWSNAETVALPSSAGATNPAVSAGQVGCISTARCVYIGSFVTTDGVSRPFITIRQDGVWHSASSPSMPSNAAAQGSQTLSELSCVTGGSCTAVGTYHTTTGTLVPFSVTITTNAIGPGVQIPLPANAAPAPKAFLFGFHGLDCTSVGNCSLGAQYSYQVNTVKHFGGFLTSEVNGVWSARSQAAFMQVPTGADSAGQFGGVVGMSCWSAGNCAGAVAYVDGARQYQVGVVLETAGVWASVTPVSMPSGRPAGAAGGLYALRCFTAATCSGVGSYQGYSGYSAFSLSSL